VYRLQQPSIPYPNSSTASLHQWQLDLQGTELSFLGCGVVRCNTADVYDHDSQSGESFGIEIYIEAHIHDAILSPSQNTNRK
jgi:hypothetical protein